MKIRKIALHPFKLPNKQNLRSGIYIQIVDQDGNEGWGECTPLPLFSLETLKDCISQFLSLQQEIIRNEWTCDGVFTDLAKLKLLPALSFGLESALLMLLAPVHDHTVKASALLMGSPKEIMQQANLRHFEGYTSAKLKVGNLNFDDAAILIHQLKNQFKLRIDVNRAWKTTASFRFFSQFDEHTFDYVEEPFQNPRDLCKFPHPFAVDESYPDELSLKDLEALPKLKALIYKPTIQGGILHCLPLKDWAIKNKITLVLSSSFESPLGLAHVSSMAHRLSLTAPIGIGTAHFH